MKNLAPERTQIRLVTVSKREARKLFGYACSVFMRSKTRNFYHSDRSESRWTEIAKKSIILLFTGSS